MSAATDFERRVLEKVAEASARGDAAATGWLRGLGGVRLVTGPDGEPAFEFVPWADYPTDALLEEAERMGFGVRPDGAGGLRLVSPPPGRFETERDRTRRELIGRELIGREDVRVALGRMADRRRRGAGG